MIIRERAGFLRRLIALIAVLTILTALLAACGEDEDAAGDVGDTGAAVEQAEPTGAATQEATEEALSEATPEDEAAPIVTGAAGVDASPQAAGDLTEVSLALDWYPWANHTGIYMAQEQGFFAEEGLEVSVHVPSDPTIGLQLVASGQDDFTISYQTDVLLARAEGLPVTSVAALVQHPLNSIMTLESSGIERPSQLVGKTIGVAGVPSDEPLLSTMLEADGASLDDVELVTVGYDLMPALLGKRVDAVIGAYWVHESILAERQGEPVNVMRIEEWGVPDYYELLLVAREEMVDEDPALVEAFVRALVRGYEYAEEHQEEAIDALVEANPETDAEFEQQSMELLTPLWTDNGEVSFGTQTEERWISYADWLRENGILSGDVDATEAFTNQFVERALSE